MSVSEKLRPKAEAIIGVPVLAVAIVVPPGATLYRSYAPKDKAMALGGPIAAAFASKLGKPEADVGMAATVPRQQGFLALTGDELVYLKKKAIGATPASVLYRWPRGDVELSFDDVGAWSYPGLALAFSDGTSCMVFGEKKWCLDVLAEAANA